MNEGRGLPPETTCLINPKAANSKWMRKKKLRDYLHSRLPGRIHDVMSNKENTVELSRRTSVRSQILIAIGGDGTIADVIQGIMEAGRHKDVALGIIPFGSGNAFRKSFGIRKNTRKAIRQRKSAGFGGTRPPAMLEMPAVRPTAAHRRVTASPIRPPPIAAESGVKFCMEESLRH